MRSVALLTTIKSSQSFLFVSSHKSYHKVPARQPVKMVNFDFATANVAFLLPLENIGIRARAYQENGVRIRRRLENGGVSPQLLLARYYEHLVYKIGDSGFLRR